MKLLIATHKDESFVENSILKPIQVGKELATKTINDQYYADNTGDNISIKNPHFNELSALYWMWKNLNSEDIVGLMHYRRYFRFFLNPLSKKPSSLKRVTKDHKLVKKTQNKETVIKKKISSWLTNYDVILPYPKTYRVKGIDATIAEDYRYHHRASDWDTTMDVIREKYPEYSNSIDLHLYNSHNKFYMANMFIAKQDWLDNYCSWLFDILFEVENRITYSVDPYQKRVIGFLGERLMSLYIHHNNFKTKHLPLLLVNEFFDNNPEVLEPKECLEP